MALPAGCLMDATPAPLNKERGENGRMRENEGYTRKAP